MKGASSIGVSVMGILWASGGVKDAGSSGRDMIAIATARFPPEWQHCLSNRR